MPGSRQPFLLDFQKPRSTVHIDALFDGTSQFNLFNVFFWLVNHMMIKHIEYQIKLFCFE